MSGSGSSFFHAHTHSSFSSLDGMSRVAKLAELAAKHGQPALGLTDHGNMAGTVQLYKACRALDILPFPGIEAYLLDPKFDGDLASKEASKAGRYHVGLLALDYEGYQALARFTSQTHTRPRFSRFPRATLADLADLGKGYGDHVALTTGCFFGLFQQTWMSEGEEEALRVLKMYASWFPHTFVEVQHHDITHDKLHDDELVREYLKVANLAGLPVIATQDSHYALRNEKKAHALMKRMVYGGAEDEFPGDSFHLASTEWVRRHYKNRQWYRIESGAEHLLDLHSLKIPPLDSYQVHVPALAQNPHRKIERLCKEELDKYYADMSQVKKRKYRDRLLNELYVIRDLDMAGYFVLVKKCVDWCKRQRILVEARGSANGSLVCFLLGITQVDPIKWDLLFERFLSRDRIKPPDIDMDIEDNQRDRFITYLRRNFDVMNIGTWAKLGMREQDDRGNVMVSYMMYLRRKCEEEAGGKNDKARALFQKRYGHIETLRDIRDINPKDYEGLRILARMGSVNRSYGVHAAGLLVSGADANLGDVIPTMLVPNSGSVATQYEQDDAEEWGFLKMDWLGQATLRTMRQCQELIGREDPLDFTWIPLDPKTPEEKRKARKAFALLRTGRPDTGIFHFEGYTKAKGGRELGVQSVRDVVLAQALYMPGAMETGQKDKYLARRRDTLRRRRVKYLHPVFEDVLSPTYGAVIFQEQVINIMRGLGMSIAGINKFFKVVKDSGKGATQRNLQRLSEVRDEFNVLCKQNGIRDTDKAWELTAGFVSYGFNRAHATGYGIRAYRVAYLKAHYPLQFMTALLQTWAGHSNAKKETLYIREARRMRIRLLPPDVNYSGSSWTLDKKRKAIRRGLVSIHGVGKACAAELTAHAPFTSIDDLVERCSSRAVTGGKVWKEKGEFIGTLAKLSDAGALDSLLG